LLRRYADLLIHRAIPMGLVGPGEASRAWDRHVQDSARALGAIPSAARSAADLGSGAGLPGLVVAIVRPDLRLLLIEPQRRRVAFLEYVIDELGLPNASVVPARAEDASIVVDVAFARAFGSAAWSWQRALPLLRPGGRLVYFAGGSWWTDEGERAALEDLGVLIEVGDQGSDPSVGPVVIIRRKVSLARG